MSFTKDKRAPTTISKAERAELEKDKELAHLVTQRGILRGELLAKYGHLKDAGQAAQPFKELSLRIAARRKKLASDAATEANANFFASVNDEWSLM